MYNAIKAILLSFCIGIFAPTLKPGPILLIDPTIDLQKLLDSHQEKHSYDKTNIIRQAFEQNTLNVMDSNIFEKIENKVYKKQHKRKNFFGFTPRPLRNLTLDLSEIFTECKIDLTCEACRTNPAYYSPSIDCYIYYPDTDVTYKHDFRAGNFRFRL